MKRYKKRTEYVEACQFDGCWASLMPLKDVVGDEVQNDLENAYFRGIKLQKGCWIVKKRCGEFVIMRDSMFQARYID